MIRALASSNSVQHLSILILQAEKDELVPPEHGLELEALCRTQGMVASRKEIPGAFQGSVRKFYRRSLDVGP